MSNNKSFWSSIPGLLTAIAAVISAAAGLIAILYQVGIIGIEKSSQKEHYVNNLTKQNSEQQQLQKTSVEEPGEDSLTTKAAIKEKYPPSMRTLTNSIGMKFVYIAPGSFTMGSPTDEPKHDDMERQHLVNVTQGFYMQTTEVTQGQWKSVMGEKPSYYHKNCGDDCPVEKVSWIDAQEFIRKLNQREGENRYRLPTEAQWEYAARAGTDTPFAFGRCLFTDQANYNGNFPLSGCPKGGEYRNKPIAVASLQPNSWGLYDMHGNVSEWCQDWYGDYPLGSVTDPAGPSKGTHRVIRGGDWYYDARKARSASRAYSLPRPGGSGFRLLRSP